MSKKNGIISDRFYEAPLVEVDQTDVTLGPDEDLVLNIKTWDNYHSKIKRDGVLRISEKNEELLGFRKAESFKSKFRAIFEAQLS